MLQILKYKHLITYNQPLIGHNTFGIKAEATAFAVLKHENQLPELIKKAKGSPIYVLGGGSNIIFRKKVEGLVLLNKVRHISIKKTLHDEVIISVGAGVNWHQLVLWTLKQGFGGLENLALIPGTVGAAPIQNIGAYGVEFKDVFEALEAYDLQTGELHHFNYNDCQFSYRDSFFKQKNIERKFYLSKICLRLSNNKHNVNKTYGAIAEILNTWNIANPTPSDIAAAVIKIRRGKLPNWQKIGNAGSFFKNPVINKSAHDKLLLKFPGLPSYPMKNSMVKLAAGWLIDQCGWKGKKINNVGCYEKQALVVVNHGKATAEEIITFSEQIIDSVKEKFKVQLEREVQII